MEKSLSDASLTTSASSVASHHFVHARSSNAVLEHQRQHHGNVGIVAITSPLVVHHVDGDVHASEPAICSSCSFVSEMLEPLGPPPPESEESESIWSRPEHKVSAFVVLLIEEFLVAYQLNKVAHALKEELAEQKLGFPNSTGELWCEMYHNCRAVLSRNGSGSSNNSAASTIEKLVEFCVGASSTRKGFALELCANSPVSVCASPKKASVTKKGSVNGVPVFSLMDAHVQMLRSPVVRPSRRSAANNSVDAHSSSGAGASSSPFIRSASLESSSSAPALVTTTSTSTSVTARPGDHTTTNDPGSPSKSSSTVVIAAKKAKKKRKHVAGNGSIAPSRHHQPQQHYHQHHHHPESYYYQSDKLHTNGHFGGTQTNVPVHASFEQRTATPGSYVEPALVLAHEAQLKRDLASVRILERELRHIRLEKIAVEPKKSLVKRLGFASMTKAESQRIREKQDPYLNDLLMEKLGFSKRFECALCQFAFLQVNLPYKVSFKCIMDVYDKWQYEPPDREYATKYRAPLCYDAVHVCRMCAQIVFERTSSSSTGDQESHSTAMAQQHHHRQSSGRKAKQVLSAQDMNDSCSDPYALPPLFGDDCYEHDALYRGEDAHEELRSTLLVESPAKAIVYANQSNEVFMTSKEWEVINPQRSSIREAIESTVRRTSGTPALALTLGAAGGSGQPSSNNNQGKR